MRHNMRSTVSSWPLSRPFLTRPFLSTPFLTRPFLHEIVNIVFRIPTNLWQYTMQSFIFWFVFQNTTSILRTSFWQMFCAVKILTIDWIKHVVRYASTWLSSVYLYLFMYVLLISNNMISHVILEKPALVSFSKTSNNPPIY